MCDFDPLGRMHPACQPLAATRDERRAVYRRRVSESLNDEDVDHIRSHLQRQHAC